jgi:hypothetical protein
MLIACCFFISNRMDKTPSYCNQQSGGRTEAPEGEHVTVDVTTEEVLVDDDLRLYPKLVDQWDHLDFDGDEMPPQFEETDEEEQEENSTMGVDEEEGVGDIPAVPYDKDNPSLAEGETYSSMRR